MNRKSLMLSLLTFSALLISSCILISSDVSAQAPGNSIYLNGSTDYISVQNNSVLNQGSTMAAEAWIRPCSVSGARAILSLHWCAGFQNAYTLSIMDSLLRWTWDNDGFGNGASYFESEQKVVQTGQWQHVAVVHRTDTVILYFNGQKIEGKLTSGNFSSIQSSNEPLRIGVIKALSGNLYGYFDGQIDELRLWDHEITSTEVATRFNTSLVGNEAGLIAYYNMEQTGMGNMAITNNAIPVNTSLFGTSFGTSNSPVFQSVSINPCSATGIFNSNLNPDYCPVEISYNTTFKLINIKSPNKILALNFTDLQGRSYVKQNSFGNQNQMTISGPQNIVNGLYVLSIQTENCTVHRKFVIPD